MERKYYKYSPIILQEEAYIDEIINEKNTYREHCFKYQRKNDFGFIWLYEYYLRENVLKHNLYGIINYYCYKIDGKFYDLLTGEILTPIDYSKNTTLEDNKIYIDIKKLEEKNVSDILSILKLFPKREMKNYREYLLESIKSKSPTEYNLNKIYNKHYSSTEEKRKEKIEKKLENKVLKLRKIK